MKTRIIYPQLWHDTDFTDCSSDAIALFMFLISNPYLGLTRYSRVSDKQIGHHTNLKDKRLSLAKEELQNIKWCYFYGEWVYHNHDCAYMDYVGRDRVLEAKETELNKVPNEIKEVFNQLITSKTNIDLSNNFNGLETGLKPVLNYKSETINHKEGIVKGNSECLELIDLFNEKFGKKYQLTEARKKAIQQRLKVFDLGRLKEAVMKLSSSGFHTGKNDRGWVADPDWLFKKDENVDKALNLGHVVDVEKVKQKQELLNKVNAFKASFGES